MDILRWIAAWLLNIIPVNEPLKTKLFNAIARHSVGIAIEAVLFRRGNNGEIEVYLTKRAPNEAYAGQWHCPGSFIRSGEMPPDVFHRLAEREFKTSIARWDYVTSDFFPEERYRTMEDRVYLVEVNSEPKNERGRWYDVNDLPLDIVEGHRKFIIPAAKEAWEK